MSGSAWLWVGLGLAVVAGVLSTLQHALREASRVELERLALRRLLAGRGGSGTNGNGSGSNGAVQGNGNGNGVGHGGGASKDLEPPETIRLIAEDLAGHSATVAIPRVFCNLISGVAMVLWVSSLGGDGGVSEIGVAQVLIGSAVGAALIWLLGVVAPLSVAEHAAERAVLSFAWLIRGLHVLFWPVRWVLGFTSEVVRRLAGEEARDSLQAREAELLQLVEESEREGGLDESAREMIEAVMEFRTTTVEQIMTPRTEVEALEYTDELERIRELAARGGHSRVPVFEESLDHVVGVLYLKDFLRWVATRETGLDPDAQGDPFTLRELLRPAMFVPETKTVNELLVELLEQKVHIAFATDEYGGLSGIVTIEDIVEEIFGEITDEYEPPEEDEPSVVLLSDVGAAVVDARAEIDEANGGLKALGVELPAGEDYDTVGGFVVTTMGKIPEVGEVLSHEGLRVEVLEAEPTRVLRVRVAAEEAAPAER